MSVEQTPEEMLRLNVDEAVHTYADILMAQRHGEQVEEEVEFRARNVAIIACSVLVSIDDSKRWPEHFVDGLAEHGVRLRTDGITRAWWRRQHRIAYASVETSRTFSTDGAAVVTALLANDPRVKIANPHRLQR